MNVYYYESVVDWKSERDGELTAQNLPSIPVSAPPEFKGHEGKWTPEHLFVASVNTCFMMTFLAIAETSKLSIVSFCSTAKGKLEKVQGSGFQITEIAIKPRVVISSSEDLQRATRILTKAKENCFVSNSIKSAVKLEPQLYHQQTPTSPCPLG
ncbi:MAG TPA: OsmC family protein [Candidatus Binatia bacterium]|nr:OsmC family protein [Candidatus Binatia bacterium]